MAASENLELAGLQFQYDGANDSRFFPRCGPCVLGKFPNHGLHLGQQDFLLPLPVGRLPGVGKVTEAKLKHLEIQTVVDLRRVDLLTLEGRLGRYGVRLYELARGIDKSEVVRDRPTQSISAEDTFEQDVCRAVADRPAAPRTHKTRPCRYE